MRLFILFFISLLNSSVSYSKSYDLKNGSVEFNTVGTPSLLNIEGKGGVIEGAISHDKGMVSGEVKVLLQNFKTGISLRDEHMHEKYLETKKYPHAVFKFKEQKDDGALEGVLTIKKDSKPVVVNYEVKDGKVNGKAKLDVKDYPSIGVPSYLGVTAAGSVDIVFTFPFNY